MRNERAHLRLGAIGAGAAMWAMCAVLATPARAATTAEELAQIEAQHAVLKAKLRVLETRAQMTARQADIDRYAPTAAATNRMPGVGSIEGMHGKLHATLELDYGHMTEVIAGDVLPNGMRVVSIHPDGVVVQRRDKTRVRLPVAVQVRESNDGLPTDKPGLPRPHASATAPMHATSSAPPTMAPTSLAPAMAPMPRAGASR